MVCIYQDMKKNVWKGKEEKAIRGRKEQMGEFKTSYASGKIISAGSLKVWNLEADIYTLELNHDFVHSVLRSRKYLKWVLFNTVTDWIFKNDE